MAYSHHTRYVSIGKESTYNTPVAATAVGEIESESFQNTYDIAKRNDMNYYGAAKTVVGRQSAEGGATMALQPDKFLANILMGIYGVHSNNTGSGPHTFSEIGIDASTVLPSYTFRVGRDEVEHIFAGQVIESISVSANMGEYAMISFSTMGAKQNDADATLATTVTGYTGDAAHFAQCFVEFEDTATDANYSALVQSIDFEIKTNRDMDNSYSLASDTCIRAPPVTTREITGSITFHKSLLSGDVASAEPYFEELRGATTASNAGLVNPGSSTPALSVLFRAGAADDVRFDFFKVQYEMPETSVSGRDSQTMTVNFHALYDLADANAMSQCVVTSTNELSNSDTF
jgi:hypothetical protein